MHETSLLNDTTFWYSVAVVIFLALAVWKGRTPLLAALDGEIAKVQAELDEAKRLREEAAETLKTYQARQQEAVKEAEAIVAKAKEDAARLRAEAEASLKADLEHHEQSAVTRIRLAQADALADVKAFIVDTALSDVRGKIAKMKDDPQSTKLVDDIIADLPNLKGRAG